MECVDHSIAGVAPAGISRRMFRCLWHTSRGSRFVMSKRDKESPHSSPRRRNIAYLLAALVDIRQEGANLFSGLALLLKTAPPGVSQAGLAPVSVGADAGVFHAGDGGHRPRIRSLISENGLGGVASLQSKKPCRLWSGRAGLPTENWPSGPIGASRRPARCIVPLPGDSNRVP